MRWNAERFEWEGETPEGVPIAVAGEAFIDAVAERLRLEYGDAHAGYSEEQVREANAAFHEPDAWRLGMPGVRVRESWDEPAAFQAGAPPAQDREAGGAVSGFW